MTAGAGVRVVEASGRDALVLATALLQRVRRTSPLSGVWEAADVQWWWRAPRASDAVARPFWIDSEGPVAGVLLTSEVDGPWQCDPVVVASAASPTLEVVFERALQLGATHAASGFEVPVRDDDRTGRELAMGHGLVAGERDNTAWMEAADRPALAALPDGFVLVDRTQRHDVDHPLRRRSGEGVARRLGECPLYDPALDLAVETVDGVVAGYSLYWLDPTTGVGLVEPVRVEDAFQRRGLARAMLTAGIDRLVVRGAQRVKISYRTDAAAAVYGGVGFRPESTTTWFRVPAPGAPTAAGRRE